MKTRFVGWALAHRDNILGQSPILRLHDHSRFRGDSVTVILVVVLLIVLAFMLLLPRILNPTHPDYTVKQKAQFHSIDAAIELFNSEFDGYPSSDAQDEDGEPYCGAMKLSEAMMGRDLMGFHPNSKFKTDGLDDSGASLYNSNTLEVRKGPYLPEANGNPCRLKDLFENIGPFDGNEYVLCDTYRVAKKISNGMYIGMPVLYYKADTSKTAHDVNNPDNPDNIYNYKDNHDLLALGVPGKPEQKHPLYENPKIFYQMTRNTRVTGPSRPYRSDTYILLSAGQDGLYGTEDDIANFDFRWRP
jgi:hypothetical protein